jgi:tRNA (guanine-N7-)-methyltransferase
MNPDTPFLPAGQQAYLERRNERIRDLRTALRGFFPVPARLTLEIGCGHGHYLTAYAQQHPDAVCLGIDLMTRRIEKACLKRDKRHLENLHFLKAEVTELLEAWPNDLRVERFFLLFPDPWPKKRHIKNRILQPDFLDQIGKIAIPGAPLHFRTDHPGNFEWGREVISAHPDWRIEPDAEWPFENPSFFQELFGNYQSLTALFTPAGRP